MRTHLASGQGTENVSRAALLTSGSGNETSASSLSLKTTLLATLRKSDALIELGNVGFDAVNLLCIFTGKATLFSFSGFDDIAHLHDEVGACLPLSVQKLRHDLDTFQVFKEWMGMNVAALTLYR
jgi:hypothetical protein